MTLAIRSFSRPEWSPPPHPDCRGVNGRVLQNEGSPRIALLHFGANAMIHEHAAPHRNNMMRTLMVAFTEQAPSLPLSHPGVGAVA